MCQHDNMKIVQPNVVLYHVNSFYDSKLFINIKCLICFYLTFIYNHLNTYNMFYNLWAYAKYDGKIFDQDKGIPDYITINLTSNAIKYPLISKMAIFHFTEPRSDF